MAKTNSNKKVEVAMEATGESVTIVKETDSQPQAKNVQLKPKRARIPKKIEKVVEDVTEEPTEEVSEQPTEEVSEQPIEEVKEQTIEEVEEQPAEEVEEQPVKKVAKKSKKKVEEQPAEDANEEQEKAVPESEAVEDDEEDLQVAGNDRLETEPLFKKGHIGIKSAKGGAPFPIEDLDKANVWGLNEQELFEMYIDGRRQDNFSENEVHYMNLIRPVFEFLFFNINNRAVLEEYESQGYCIFSVPSTSSSNALAIKRRPIKKITDITLENIYHIQPAELLHLIDENMGTGWQGLPLYLQDIILAGFYVDCSVLPGFALHKPGGIIDRRKDDGYEVLEIARGSWIEAVFVKVKPKQDKLHFEAISDKPMKKKSRVGDDDDDGEDYDDEDDDLDDDDEELDDAEEDEDEGEEPQFEDIDMIDEDSED